MRPKRDQRRGARARARARARAGASASASGRARAHLRPLLRGRLWVETDGGGAALTDAGADLLEQIAVAGSLSEAARRLHFSYRRAWMLVDAMNRRWPAPLVTLATGGKRGGGARLTDLGRRVLGAFRDLQLRFEHFLDTSRSGFDKSTRT